MKEYIKENLIINLNVPDMISITKDIGLLSWRCQDALFWGLRAL